ncbi:hypothetical protein C7212DRAFT_367083, partial [Tuber magnatum]
MLQIMHQLAKATRTTKAASWSIFPRPAQFSVLPPLPPLPPPDREVDPLPPPDSEVDLLPLPVLPEPLPQEPWGSALFAGIPPYSTLIPGFGNATSLPATVVHPFPMFARKIELPAARGVTSSSSGIDLGFRPPEMVTTAQFMVQPHNKQLLVPDHKYPKTGIKETYGKVPERIRAPIQNILVLYP